MDVFYGFALCLSTQEHSEGIFVILLRPNWTFVVCCRTLVTLALQL